MTRGLDREPTQQEGNNMQGTSNAPVDAEETTQRVASLYSQVLEIPEIGADDDFFVAGGTSLSALTLLDLVAAEFGVQVPVRTFYQATSVRDLAREVQLLAAKG
ncbi:MAG TPA: acyl carrier protein [Jatrophihabitans sp.]|jgi:acyl carrier protein|uniref:acyl carrier protein n=1 Tax=Jatrophihabitans sp. TaxID=1932789 RepID=UPI002F0A0C8C